VSRLIRLAALPAAVAVGVTAPAVANAATTSPASPASATRVSALDRQFLRANEQTNLAELTLARIIMNKSGNPHAKALARVTMRQHVKARTLARKVAKQYNVTLPSEPNAQQRQAAAEVQSSKRKAYTYFKVQIVGHRESIASTRKEIKSGTNSNVISYAKTYLPLAQMHLKMAQQDLHRLERNS
jgi:putative membrane protein